jgi:hypothetical protein
MEVSKEKLEAFFKWLKNDGLPPKKSERLWRKTITQKLLNNDKMTQENFKDFLKSYSPKELSQEDKEAPVIDPKSMIGSKLRYRNNLKIVQNAIDADSFLHLFFTDGSHTLVCKKFCINLLRKG